MKSVSHLIVLLFTLLLAPAVLAQFGPRVLTTVNPDRSITFRLEAPAATDVQVRMANGSRRPETTPLIKDADGVWSASLGPLAPDLYEYQMIVDGVVVADPGNGLPKPERAARTSLVLVPGNPLVDERDVPHGTIHEETLNSTVAGATRPLLVYTPPGYAATAKLPLLVLYHGAGDTTWSWVRQGRIAQNLDNAIAQGTVMPLVIVAAETYALQTTDANLLARDTQTAVDAELFADILPFVEKHYGARTSNRCRAIAGLSMGGGQALFSALRHPSAFSAVSLLSPAWIGELPLPDTANAHYAFQRFEIVTGTADAFLYMQEDVDRKLTQAGIAHDYVKLSGGDHSMFVWRPALRTFVEQLTRDYAAGKWCPKDTNGN